MNQSRRLPAAAASSLFLACFLVPLAASAAVEEPWNLPALTASPEAILKAAAAQPAPKDGDIDMLFEEHVYKLDEQGREHRIQRRVYRYLTEKGVDDWSTTEADWSPWCEEKPVFRVRVITPDGQAHALDQESIGEVPAAQDSPDLFSDDKLLRAPLPAIVVGAVVEEEIETREVHSLFAQGIVERFLLTQAYPVRKLRLVIDAPASLPLKYRTIASEVQPQRTESNGRVALVYELGPLPASPAQEPYLPAEEMKTPQVGFSTGRSWSDIAAAYAKLVESHLDLDAVRPLVEKAVGSKTEGGDAGRDEIIKRLLAALRAQVRYTGIEFGKGAIVPRSPHETLARRYGDCKDQAALLVAMLRVAGIPAQVALLRTGRYDDVVPELPGIGDFDHAIVYVPASQGPRGGRALWIDPSARCAPVGYIPLVDQNRLALIASAETHDLIRTAETDYKDNFGNQLVEMFPADSGKGRVRVTVNAGGSYVEDLREDYASLGIKALRKRWKDFFKEQFRSQASPRMEYSPPLDLTKPFHVTAEASDCRIGQFDETAATVILQPDGLFQRLPDMFRGVVADDDDADDDTERAAASDSRKGPLFLPEPHRRQLTYRITLPAGYTVKSLPESSEKHYGPATIGQHFAKESDNVVVATFSLDTGAGRFTAEEVDDLRSAIAGLAKDENSPWEVKIELENIAAEKMAAGNTADALAHARAEMARYADRADQHSAYSRLLLKAGLGDGARAEARKAVELEPRSAVAYENLARTLTYDLLGRQFRPGMDWAGAAEAYKKALELDPSDVSTRMDWAILLEHDDAGLRYAPGTRLDEAIEEYRKAQRQLGMRNRLDSLEMNLALDLLFREKYADLEKLASRGKSAAWHGFFVAAVAAEKDVSEANHAATMLADGGDARREVLQKAAEYLDEARLYAPAGALYEEAGHGAANAKELRTKGRQVARLRRREGIGLADDPVQALRTWLVAGLLGGSELDKAQSVLSASAGPAEIEAARQALFQAVHPALENARQHQLPLARVIDGVLQADYTVEGDAAAGYVVHVSGENLSESQWRVAIISDHPRIVPPKPSNGTVDEAAWTAVLAGAVNQQTLAAAADAAKVGKSSPACLRTLAAVYAELGKTPDALENLRRAVELRGDRLDGSDWYILGRIAEQYGLNDLATDLYRKVPSQPSAGDGLFTLAQRRLRKMEK